MVIVNMEGSCDGFDLTGCVHDLLFLFVFVKKITCLCSFISVL